MCSSIAGETSSGQRIIDMKTGIIVEAENGIDYVADRAIYGWLIGRGVEGDRFAVEPGAIVVDRDVKGLFDLGEGTGDIYEQVVRVGMGHGEAMRVHPGDDLLLLLWSRIKGLIGLGLGQVMAIARGVRRAYLIEELREGLLIAQGQANGKGKMIGARVVSDQARLTTCDGGRDIARECFGWGRSRGDVRSRLYGGQRQCENAQETQGGHGDGQAALFRQNRLLCKAGGLLLQQLIKVFLIQAKPIGIPFSEQESNIQTNG